MNSRYCFKQKTYAIIGLLVLIFVFTYISTVAYSAINSTLTITGDALARIEKNIRVTDVKLLSVSDSGMELYSPEHSADTITTGVQLDTLSSKVTYQVTVKNNSNKPMTIGQIKFGTYSNSKMTYDCDFEIYTKIDSKSSMTINIVFKYNSSVTSLPSDKVLQSTINFIFEEMPKPVLARSDTWYKGSTSKELITSITIADKYVVPSGKTVIESWDASDGNKKSVTAYILDDYSLVLSGNGEGNGKVIANENSNESFGSASGQVFDKCSIFDMSLLDTSNVTTMADMFFSSGSNASSVEIKGLENFDVSNVTNMEGVFGRVAFYSQSLSIGNIDDWDVSNVTDFSWMFHYTGYASTTWDIGDLSNWNVGSATNFELMFDGAGYSSSTFDIGNLNNWKTSNVTNMRAMFRSAGINSTTWNVGKLDNWNTSEVTNMSEMFYQAGKNTQNFSLGDLDNWNTGNVTDMSEMFYMAGYKSQSFSLGNLDNWNTAKVTDMSYLFSHSGHDSKSWSVGDLSKWDTSKATSMSYMFAVTSYSAASWDVGDLGDWDTSNVTNMSSMFFYACNKSTCVQSTFDLSEWDTSNVTNMNSMFMGIRRIEEFNIFNWDVSNVTNFSRLFREATFVNDSIDFCNWNISNATNIYGMFSYIYSVKSIDISSWNTSKVTDMKEMFNFSPNIETIYVGSGWNTSNVTSSTKMFYNTPKLPNYDSNVIDKTNAHANAGGYLSYPPKKMKINNISYGYEDGMTWNDWFLSNYNTTNRTVNDVNTIKDVNGNVVDLNTNIIEGASYNVVFFVVMVDAGTFTLSGSGTPMFGWSDSITMDNFEFDLESDIDKITHISVNGEILKFTYNNATSDDTQVGHIWRYNCMLWPSGSGQYDISFKQNISTGVWTITFRGYDVGTYDVKVGHS